MPRRPRFHYRPSRQRQAVRKSIMAGFPGGVPRNEYPRPQFVRPRWLCLNGVWEFLFDPHDVGLRERWQEAPHFPDFIIVPFAYQTEWSAKSEKDIHEVCWYARSFEVPPDWRGGDDPDDILLHFGAVDYQSTVWVNGEEVGHNQGGHVPFHFDITPYLKPGKNRLVVRVEDRQSPYQPRGKQNTTGRPKGCDYYCTTGIWQTVWLEPAPSIRIAGLRLTSVVGENPAEDALEVRVFLHAPSTGWHVRVEALDGDAVVAAAEDDAAHASARLRLPMPHAKRWSPDSPHLYDVRVRLTQNGTLLDEVASYAGLRSVTLHDARVLLNGEPVYLKMVLDQGYWPQTGMTAPSDDALRADVEFCKRFGFNGARKHQKLEDPRWLYWCDRLGLLVWGEMANARAWSHKAEEQFLAEWERAVRRDANHPSIITWVPINESSGLPNLEDAHPAQAAFVERLVELTRRLDPERPVVDNDGWEHTDVSDICAIHDYTTNSDILRARYAPSEQTRVPPPHGWGSKPRQYFLPGARYRGQPVVLSEVGGLLTLPNLPKEQWDPLYNSYASCRTPEELLERYRELMETLGEFSFLAGFCYTQLTDIEQEINGLLTYDRQPKIEPERVAEVHRTMFRRRERNSQ